VEQNPILHVVAALIVVDSKVLACRRAAHKSAAGQWEFPGGKVESGEDPHKALVREIKEEFGLDCETVSTFDISDTPVENQIIRLESILCRGPFSQELESTDHDDFAWVSASESQRLNWAMPDLPALNRLVDGNLI
jgi:8-oxo-dGTP diphosphatase